MTISRDTILVIINILLMTATFFALAKIRAPRYYAFDRDATTPLRFILAAFVANHHLPWLISFKLGTPAVAVFFFISGYGMVKSFLATEGHTRGGYLKGFRRKQFMKLFVPYFVCAIPWMAYLYLKGVCGDMCYNLMYIIDCIKQGNVDVILPNSWFPWVLFLFGMIFSVAYKISAKGLRLICVFLGIAFYYAITRYVLCFGANWYISSWAFVIGCAYAEYEENVIQFIKKIRWGYPLLMLGAYLILRFYIDSVLKGVPLVSEFSHVMLGIVIVTALYFFPLPRWKWLVLLGGISYEYYLCHGEVAYALKLIGVVNVKAITIFTLLLSIPVAWLVHLVSRKSMSVIK